MVTIDNCSLFNYHLQIQQNVGLLTWILAVALAPSFSLDGFWSAYMDSLISRDSSFYFVKAQFQNQLLQ